MVHQLGERIDMEIRDSFESAMKPGKYDPECEAAYKATEAKGVMLLVIDGKHGNGFSAILRGEMVVKVPVLLRRMAQEIENEAKKAIGN